MKREKCNSIINIETIIIIAIAACVLFLNVFTINKLSELDQAGTEAMFIKDGLEYPESEDLREEIIKYRPQSCKMIEMYDEKFELLFSLQFDETHPIHTENINDYPDLLELLKTTEEGQTTVKFEKSKEEVYFKWVTNNRNEERLVIVYSTKHIVENVWIFSFVCYLVLILVFVLLIRLHTQHYNDKINQYMRSSNNFRDEISRM